MKPAEYNTQNRAPVLATESGGADGGHLEASAKPVTSGHNQSLSSGAEVFQAQNINPTEGVLNWIASNYLQTTPPTCMDDHNKFLAYMERMRLVITGVSVGSLLITVKCDSVEVLEGLWEDYSSGHLGNMVQKCFVTEEILMELNLEELKLKTTISEEEYKQCKAYLEKKG